MAWKKQTTIGTKHNDTCTMSFGRPSSHGDCPRCQELKNGAAPRQSWDHHKKEMEERRRQAIAEHFKPGGRHDQIIAQGGIDTAFDW